MAIEAGLRADIFRKKLLNKNILSTEGDMYANNLPEPYYEEDTEITDEESFNSELEKYGKLYKRIPAQPYYVEVHSYTEGETYYIKKYDIHPEALSLGESQSSLCSRDGKQVWETVPNTNFFFSNYLNKSSSDRFIVKFSTLHSYARYDIITTNDSATITLPQNAPTDDVTISGREIELTLLNDKANRTIYFIVRNRRYGYNGSTDVYSYYTYQYYNNTYQTQIFLENRGGTLFSGVQI